MNIDELKKNIEVSYGLKVESLEKIKNVYRIKTAEEDYCLKIIKYNFPHFWFILSAIKHLQNNGFERIPEILSRIDGADYVSIDRYNAYLTKWINARECNYDNPLDLAVAAGKLAELHNKSQGFKVTSDMQPRNYWHMWGENFKTRRDEIFDFKKRIELKENKSEFDQMYLLSLEKEIDRANKAVEHLLRSSYFEKVKEEKANGGFCHHDYAHHNVLIEESGAVDIIDFDYCILDTHLHDLASLMLRRLKNGKWDIEDAIQIMGVYNGVKGLNPKDIPIMAAFMEFPQDYWQVGIQYYWEKQPWGEEFFLKKLKKIYEDNDEKQEFIDEFRELNFRP